MKKRIELEPYDRIVAYEQNYIAISKNNHDIEIIPISVGANGICLDTENSLTLVCTTPKTELNFE